MKKDFKVYLFDILRSMELTQEFIQNLALEDFRSDEKTQFAVNTRL